jgi:hypothetical protein
MLHHAFSAPLGPHIQPMICPLGVVFNLFHFGFSSAFLGDASHSTNRAPAFLLMHFVLFDLISISFFLICQLFVPKATSISYQRNNRI